MTCRAYLITLRLASGPLSRPPARSGRGRTSSSRRAAANPLRNLGGRHRPRQVVTLHRIAVELDELLNHRFGLDAFRDHAHAEVVREIDDGAHQRVVLAITETDDERPVDLDLVDRQPPQVTQ